VFSARSAARAPDDRFELGERRSDVVQQVARLGVVDPTFERDLEDCHSNLRGQARPWFGDATAAQRLRGSRRERRELQSLPLLKLRVSGNEVPACPGACSVLGHRGCCGFERSGDRVERPDRVGRGGDGVNHAFLQLARAPEQDLALVGEVAKEGSLCESRPRSDLRDRGLGEPALTVEIYGGLLEPAARVRFPSAHEAEVTPLQSLTSGVMDDVSR
jgi:hypothetical protein